MTTYFLKFEPMTSEQMRKVGVINITNSAELQDNRMGAL